MYPVPRNEQNEVQEASPPDPVFEQIYLKAKNKDNQSLSDAEVGELPNTFFYSLHRAEWEQKADLVRRLIAYLQKKEGNLRMMDLWCETGWLAANLAKDSAHEVYAVGRVTQELTQGARVFPYRNLHFILGDIFEDILTKSVFDHIILFDAIQYFPSLEELVNRCREYLKPGGEIHILGSPLYLSKDIEAHINSQEARLSELKSEELIPYLYYHPREVLRQYDHEYLYKPGGWKSLWRKNVSPFPWIRISN